MISRLGFTHVFVCRETKSWLDDIILEWPLTKGEISCWSSQIELKKKTSCFNPVSYGFLYPSKAVLIVVSGPMIKDEFYGQALVVSIDPRALDLLSVHLVDWPLYKQWINPLYVADDQSHSPFCCYWWASKCECHQEKDQGADFYKHKDHPAHSKVQKHHDHLGGYHIF